MNSSKSKTMALGAQVGLRESSSDESEEAKDSTTLRHDVAGGRLVVEDKCTSVPNTSSTYTL